MPPYPDRTPAWRRYLRLIRPPIARDVDDELWFHFQSRIEELVRLGATAEEARAQTEREFGDVHQVRSDLVSIDHRAAANRGHRETLGETLSDMRYALRSLMRSPGLTLGVVLLLALGIGANAAMFTFLETVFLRMPEGVVNPHEIRRLWSYLKFVDGPQYWPGYSYPQYEAVRDAVGDRAALALYTAASKVKIGLGETAASAQVSMANVAFFSLTGVRPEFGRLFDTTEDRLDGPERVAVVSHRYWENALNGDRAAIGRPVTIAGSKYIVVGVLREPFVGVDLDATDIWIPLAFRAEGRGGKTPWWKGSGVNGFQLLVRPSPGANEAQLEQRITAALRRPLFGATGDTSAIGRFGSIVRAAGPGKRVQEVEVGVRLAGVALIVLIIACANVVNLLLGRAVQRQREIAVRLALGIGRWRLMRLLFAETGILAIAAGVAALVVAYVAGIMLRRLLLPDIHWATSPVDGRVVSFALAVTIVAATIAGLFPALQSAAADVTSVLKSRGGTAKGSRLRATLVASQAALSALLLCGAVLFVKSLSNVRGLDLGYDAQRLITATVYYDTQSRTEDPTFPSRLAEVAERMRTLPGVAHVALAGSRPLYSISFMDFFTDRDSMHSGFQPTFAAVSRGYFEASGIRLLRGSDFRETPAGEHEVIVSETMARRGFDGGSALGKCMRFGTRDAPCFRVIGIVEDSRERGIIEDPQPKYFISLNDLPAEAGKWKANFVTLDADPARIAPITASIRTLLRGQFPGSIPQIIRLSDYLEPQYRPWRLGATLFSAFGVLALVVAVIGIYSTMSYGVQQRVHEFGVRIALGARATDVVRLVIGQGIRIVALGIVVGLGLAILSGQLVVALLYGVQPTDGATIALVTGFLLVAGVAATMPAAWRAASVDPAATLKSD